MRRFAFASLLVGFAAFGQIGPVPVPPGVASIFPLDKGTCFDFSGGLLTELFCWQGMSSIGPLDPRCGAFGDNKHDDTNALQTCINLTVDAGVTFELPAGTYKTSGTLNVSGANGYRITGNQAGSTIISTSVGNGPVIQFDSTCKNFEIDHLTIQGNESHGIYVTGDSLHGKVSNAWIHDNVISGANNDAGWNADVYPAGIAVSQILGARIDNNVMTGNGYCPADGGGYGFDISGSYLDGGPNDDIIITRNRATSPCTFTNIGLYAAGVFDIADNYSSGAKVQSTTAGANGGYGIAVYHSAGSVEQTGRGNIVNNRVQTVQGTGIYVQTFPYTNVVGNYVENCCSVENQSSLLVGGIAVNSGPASIVGNTVNGGPFDGISLEGFGLVASGNTVSDAGFVGIKLSLANDVAITGNTLINNAYGIATLDMTANTNANPGNNLTIVGNDIYGSSHHGIGIRNMTNVSVSGNEIHDNASVGVYLFNVNNCEVGNNNIHDNTTYGLDLQGVTHCQIHGNSAYTLDGGQTYGIFDNGSNDYLYVFGNQAWGNSTSDMSALSGTNSSKNMNRLGLTSQINVEGHNVTAGNDLANQVLLQGDVSSNPVHVIAVGSDNNIPLRLEPKGNSAATAYSTTMPILVAGKLNNVQLTAPQDYEEGNLSCSTGTTGSITLHNFSSAPACFCTDVNASSAHACAPSGNPSSSAVTFLCNASDTVFWWCVGPK